MAIFISILLSGLTEGVLYALVGVGLVMIYNGSKVINFAYGDVVAILAYLAYALFGVFHSNLIGVFVSLAVLAALLGLGLRYLIVDAQEKAMRPAMRIRGLFSDDVVLKMIVSTIGISLIIQGIEPWIWGAQSLRLPIDFPAGNVSLLGASVPMSDFAVIVPAAVVFGLLWLMLRYTKTGFDIRAVFDNPYGANLVGVDISRVFTVVWILGSLIAAVAVVLTSPIIYVSSTSYDAFAFVAFVAVVLGGLDSIPGAIIGGLLMGIVTALIDSYLSPGMEEVILFVFTIAVLVVRPRGILSGPVQERV